MLRVLSLLEARVLGVLIEKERTVPDSYPLTLNALVAGCNQKTSRDPVLNGAETDVQAALAELKSMVLVIGIEWKWSGAVFDTTPGGSGSRSCRDNGWQ
jgi:uncharacterized protein YceH (UPF0502 family)